MIDVQQARAETPGCHERVHLNNAGAALMSRSVLDAQIHHLRLEARIGGYEAAREAEADFDQVYDSVARLIGARREEIALVENATVAWQLAFHSLDLQSGDRVLTAEAEYAANYISYLKIAEERGVRVEVVPSDGDGALDVDALRQMLDDRVRLISVTHVPTNGGLVNPAEEIGAVAREARVPFLLDACQSVGQLDVDVRRIGCDFLTVTGRKYLRGPRGTGFLYVRKSMLEQVRPPVLDLHGATWVSEDSIRMRPDARRYENWEFNHASVLALGVAVEEALGWGIGSIETTVTSLAARLRERLEAGDLPTYDLGRRRAAIVTTAVPGRDAAEVRDALFDSGINVSVATPASTLIDSERRSLPDLIRVSPHYYNTDEEIEAAVEALVALRP